jgi:hypothetical protein
MCTSFKYTLLSILSVLGSTVIAQVVPPQAMWNPAGPIVSPAPAAIYWFWNDTSETPVSTRIASDGQADTCPSELITAPNEPVASSGNKAWLKSRPGIYVCVLEWTLRSKTTVKARAKIKVN